jgi:hypothetical protein
MSAKEEFFKFVEYLKEKERTGIIEIIFLRIEMAESVYRSKRKPGGVPGVTFSVLDSYYYRVIYPEMQRHPVVKSFDLSRNPSSIELRIRVFLGE